MCPSPRTVLTNCFKTLQMFWLWSEDVHMFSDIILILFWYLFHKCFSVLCTYSVYLISFTIAHILKDRNSLNLLVHF